jgi:hypothetical protein
MADGCCGFSDLVDAVNTVVRDAVIFVSAAGNAWGTDQVGGAGRSDVDQMSGLTDHEKAVAKAGQMTGDAAAVVTGVGEVIVAGGGELASVGIATPAALVVGAHGLSSVAMGATNLAKGTTNSGGDNNSSNGSRTKNRLPDKGEPNSTQTNKPGTTTKKYGPDGNVQKEFNRGHQGSKVPKNERTDHVHDYKPNSNNPSGRGDRQSGRPPKRNELKKDFGQ